MQKKGPQDEHIVENIELNIWEALIPVVILMALLAYNIFAKDGAWSETILIKSSY